MKYVGRDAIFSETWEWQALQQMNWAWPHTPFLEQMGLSTTRVDDGHHTNKDTCQPLIPLSLSFSHSLSLPIDLSKAAEDGHLPLK